MNEYEVYLIDVQGDFLSKQTHAKPTNALADLIWNSLDADATLVEVKEESYDIGEKRIVISDNGTGFKHSEAEVLFRRLGGSWKHQAGETKGKHRFLHGSEGKGRFKAFSLGRVVDWEVRFKEGDGLKQFSVSMLENSIREVRITAPLAARDSKTGVRCVISELH